MKSLVLTLNQEDLAKRRDALYKYLLLLFLFSAFFFLSNKSYGQCEMKFEYEVENCTAGKSDGKIFLTLKEGEGPFVFSLFDRYQAAGQKFSRVSKKIYLNKGERIIVFENVAPSSYWVQVDNGKCKYTIGGLEGINLEEKK